MFKRQILPDMVQNFVQVIKRNVMKWSIQRPFLSLSLIVLGCVVLLPLITVAALTPLSLLLTYSGLVASQGVIYIVYNIIIQGLLLAMILVILFIICFSIATGASVWHSYKIF